MILTSTHFSFEAKLNKILEGIKYWLIGACIIVPGMALMYFIPQIVFEVVTYIFLAIAFVVVGIGWPMLLGYLWVNDKNSR